MKPTNLRKTFLDEANEEYDSMIGKAVTSNNKHEALKLRMGKAILNDDADEIVRLHKEEDADINASLPTGYPYIHAAVYDGNFKAFGALLMLGADRSDRPGITSLADLIYDSHLCTTTLFEWRSENGKALSIK